MIPIQFVTLAASFLTTIGPATQLWHIVRTKSTEGLSTSTFFMISLSTMMSLLIGVQYKIGYALIWSFAAVAFQIITLSFINRKLAIGLTSFGLLFAAAAAFGPKPFSDAATGTAYAELVAFTWGSLFAVTFIPQVLMTRRTRATENLSMANLSITAAGLVLWTVFAVSVANYSMTFWLVVVVIALAELIRLKLSEKRSPVGQGLGARRHTS